MILEWINDLFETSDQVFWAFYVVIVILAAITYKLGFAIKLPLLKSIVVYILLIIGSFLLAVLGLGMPIAEILVGAIVVLAIYRGRMALTGERDVDNRDAG